MHVVAGMYDDALAASRDRAENGGGGLVHAYDQPEMILGAATLARELEQQADVDRIVVAVGGGGLVGGGHVVPRWACGHRRRDRGLPTMSAARSAGHPVEVGVDGLAADALGARWAGDLAFAAQRWVDDVVVVPDEAVADAQRRLWSTMRIATEPAGAAALAALTTGAVVDPAERVAVVLAAPTSIPGRSPEPHPVPTHAEWVLDAPCGLGNTLAVERIRNGWRSEGVVAPAVTGPRARRHPIVAGLISLIVFGVVGGSGLAAFADDEGNVGVGGWILLAIATLLATWVSVIGQAAVISGAGQRMDGADPTLGSSFAGARSRTGRLLEWAVLATVVAIVVDTLRQRLGILGNIVASLGNMAFNVLSFLALPVIVFEDVGAIDGFKRSSKLLRGTWASSSPSPSASG